MTFDRTIFEEETPEDRARELQVEREQRRQEQTPGAVGGEAIEVE